MQRGENGLRATIQNSIVALVALVAHCCELEGFSLRRLKSVALPCIS